jgi:NADH dehydrogenase FAD-containing subunit
MVTLLHSQAQILPEVNEKLRLFAHRRMVKRGIKLLTNTKVTEVTGAARSSATAPRSRVAP